MALGSKSTLNELAALREELHAALDALLEQSQVYERQDPPGVVVLGRRYRFSALAPEHQPLLGVARNRLATWEELAGGAVRASVPSRHETFLSYSERMHEIVDQAAGSVAPGVSTSSVRERIAEDLEAQWSVLTELPSGHGAGGLLLVPDTNALLWQPALEEWDAGVEEWTTVLLPQVIREMDQLKIREREIAKKAEAVIRRLKEYRRRGDMFKGVPIAGRASLRAVAIEATMENAPIWLRSGHVDDELLASVLELKREDLNAKVVLVTRDLNMQNKAELARVAWVDVEEIAPPVSKPRVPVTPSPEEVDEARTRLDDGLAFARSVLEIPPESRATQPAHQSWTVRVTPIRVGDAFARKVLSEGTPEWFVAQVGERFPDGHPLRQGQPSPSAGARGFSIRHDFGLHVPESVRVAVDSGGLVGVRLDVEIGNNNRAFFLGTVQEHYFHRLVTFCAAGLGHLGADGPALIDIYVLGVSDSQVLVGPHPTLHGLPDGWLKQGFIHMSEELISTESAAVDAVVDSWTREFAREAGIPAYQPG